MKGTCAFCRHVCLYAYPDDTGVLECENERAPNYQETVEPSDRCNAFRWGGPKVLDLRKAVPA